MNHQLEERFLVLEKKYRNLKRAIFFFLSLFFIVIFAFAFTSTAKFNIIRAKGIIIEDESGKDRILIGAPIPFSKDRVRTDLQKVKELWAKKYGEKYMEWYKDYYHGTYGMVVMDEKGIDKLLAGDKLADANSGVRISDDTGILWNDENGMERGGVGVGKLKKTGQYRGVLGFDTHSGAEGFHLAQMEDGSQLLRMVYEDGHLLFGQARPNSFLNNKEPFAGFLIYDANNKLIYEQNLLRKNKDKE